MRDDPGLHAIALEQCIEYELPFDILREIFETRRKNIATNNTMTYDEYNASTSRAAFTSKVDPSDELYLE